MAMMMHAYNRFLSVCACGGAPAVHNAQVAEDAVETWASCQKCGRHTDYFEDAFSTPEQAVSAWNAGEIIEAKAVKTR